jgi:beta-lactamase class A
LIVARAVFVCTPLISAAAVLTVASCSTGTVNRSAITADVIAERMRERIAATPGAEVGVALIDLGSDKRLEIFGDPVFHAASTMKVPVLLQLLRESDAGTLPIDSAITLANAFRSIVDGSPYALNASDDSDSLVYTRIGDTVSLAFLAERMITHSSNLATNALIALLDPVQITAMTRELGATHMEVLRGVEDNVAFRAGRNNTATANDLAVLLATVERGTALSAASTQRVRDILLRQAFNDQIPAGLPAGTPVAHKTGQITGTLHDAAIIYPPGRAPYVLVVLTRGIPEPRDAEVLTADLARISWEWMVGTAP